MRARSTDGGATATARGPGTGAGTDPRIVTREPAPERERAEVDAARNDPSAFAPLYERYVDAVYGYCLRRTNDREHAADLTGQIFTHALAAIPRYRSRADGEGGTFRAWLFAIAHNLVVDTHRTRRDHASYERIVDTRPFVDTGPTPHDLAEQGELRGTIIRALDVLSDGQRAVVELRLAGLTGPEIAAALDMRLAAVKSAQFRAYARLRDELTDARGDLDR